jgi:polyisoprenoid-binding protein YceI
MGIADINGDFKKFNVKISTPNGEFDDASIEMSAEVSSVSTGIEMRDNHLKTADFFDALQYPTLSFKSTEVKKLKNREYLVKGNLTMHGITKPVTLSAFHNGTVKNESGINIAGFKLTGIIKRSDFGVGQPSPGLSDEVKLICDLEVTQD